MFGDRFLKSVKSKTSTAFGMVATEIASARLDDVAAITATEPGGFVSVAYHKRKNKQSAKTLAAKVTNSFAYQWRRVNGMVCIHGDSIP